MADPIPQVLTDAGEDWPKRTWDFWRDDDTQVDTIAEVALILSVGELDAAAMVATYPYPKAIPPRLMMEAHSVLRG